MSLDQLLYITARYEAKRLKRERRNQWLRSYGTYGFLGLWAGMMGAFLFGMVK